MVWGVPFIVTLMVSPAALDPALLSGCGASVGAGVSTALSALLSLLSGAAVGSGVGAGVAVAVLLVSWSTVMVCSGREPSAPLFRSASAAEVEPATSVRPASSLSVLASRLSVMACRSSARCARSAVSAAVSLPVPPFLRAV